MNHSLKLIGRTKSVCPVCLKVIDASKISVNGDVFLVKTCPIHKEFKTLIWKNNISYEGWGRPKNRLEPIEQVTPATLGCPYDCGLCNNHRQQTCCVLVEVTNRCNLVCPICFADAQRDCSEDISLETLKKLFTNLMAKGGPYNIQLSGGEPTVRDDLSDIITIGKEAGFEFFQLNTNGIRIAQDLDYLKKLCDVGLSCVFLQFDGLSDQVYQKIRGKSLLSLKKQAIENCKSCGVGVVLVPTLIKGVNTHEIGAILDFALESLPDVRGVHFQPVSYFGRYEGFDTCERLTIPELLFLIEEQTHGKMKMADFSAGSAENPYCSFSRNYILNQDGSLHTLGNNNSSCCGEGDKKEIIGTKEASERSRKFVARQWSRSKPISTYSDTASLDSFLSRINEYSLAVSCMTFMDSWNLDTERLQDCYIHVAVQSGENFALIPFCAYNLTSTQGESIHKK